MGGHIYIPFVAALVPLIIGFVWYNPSVFGKAWMHETGMTEEKAKGANMALIFGLTYLFSVFVAFCLMMLTIHQIHVGSIFAGDPSAKDPNSEVGRFLADFFAKYGNNFRTFKHGAFHGTIAGILIALPVIGVNALFERRSFKYIAINAGYWIVSFALMGGLICAFF